ncbi:hypothetical protein CUR178_03473 [Leishmania enriettii]|uniref:Uncharacterized protein n=1 Tax=Leishmania enriettii TaxID=5663 RepID=A0A836KM85_LEIEN|nr:hypothetical protein CUR178_03473 [Leishmania enriettii]
MARALVFALSLLVLAAAVNARELHLPADIYDNAAGEWSVEVTSSFRLPLFGSVTFQNTTAVVNWQEEGAPVMIISRQSPDSSLSMAALADFLTRDGHELSYAVCGRQDNYLSTPQRPTQVAGMTMTYMVAYSGVPSRSLAGGTCDNTSERTVTIQALGEPFKPKSGKEWYMREALYTIDIIVDTINMEGTCVDMRGTGASNPVRENKKRPRKRRAHRTLRSGLVVSKADEMAAENGVVTLRFIRRSAAHQPWFLRHYTPIVFAATFITYRIVHSFCSARAAES